MCSLIFLFILTLLKKDFRSKRREVFLFLFQAVEEPIILLIHITITFLQKLAKRDHHKFLWAFSILKCHCAARVVLKPDKTRLASLLNVKNDVQYGSNRSNPVLNHGVRY